jgi:hypothetical protein
VPGGARGSTTILLVPPWVERWKPAVRTWVLLALAGALWLVVGGMLVSMAVGWLRAAPGARALPIAVGGAGALVIHHLGFLRIVDRNLGRIRAMAGTRCVFAFMPARSYLLIAVMMATGIALRRSRLPRPLLAGLYLAIGGALVLSSLRYLRVLVTGRPRA